MSGKQVLEKRCPTVGRPKKTTTDSTKSGTSNDCSTASHIKTIDCGTQTISQRYTVDLRKLVVQRTSKLQHEHSMAICHLMSQHKGYRR